MSERDADPIRALFQARPKPLSRRLEDIAAAWDRVQRRHIPVAFGCACGAPTAHISPRDFELNVMDFILARYAAASEASAFLDRLTRRDISGLLEELGQLDPAPSFAEEIAADLARSIGSFAAGGRRLSADEA